VREMEVLLVPAGVLSAQGIRERRRELRRRYRRAKNSTYVHATSGSRRGRRFAVRGRPHAVTSMARLATHRAREITVPPCAHGLVAAAAPTSRRRPGAARAPGWCCRARHMDRSSRSPQGGRSDSGWTPGGASSVPLRDPSETGKRADRARSVGTANGARLLTRAGVHLSSRGPPGSCPPPRARHLRQRGRRPAVLEAAGV